MYRLEVNLYKLWAMIIGEKLSNIKCNFSNFIEKLWMHQIIAFWLFYIIQSASASIAHDLVLLKCE